MGTKRTSSAAAPRRTVFAVERERRGRVWLLFGLLVLVWLVPLTLLLLVGGLVVYAFVPAASLFVGGVRWYQCVPTVAVAAIGAAFSWVASQRDARARLLKAMGGRPLDPHDRYHQRLANIVEEMRLAGGERRVEVVVVPSLGMNAFAFSDLHGGSVIGVSEGLVSGLPRAQLQGVVAHEFAHVLSRSHVTVTIACLLTGMWESIGDSMGRLGDDGGQDVTAQGAAAAGSVFAGLMQLIGAIVNAALSRQREFEADAAAVRYTRDPMALALALRSIACSPLGTGYVPPGLAALCITAERARLNGRTAALIASHPPVEERIAALLRLANAGPDELEAQAAQADEITERRTHVTDAGSPASSSRSVPGAGAACPACGRALEPADYEGVAVAVCRSCGGRLLASADVARVSTRREVRFSAEQYREADRVLAEGDARRRAAIAGRHGSGAALRGCPVCGRPMVRRHFNLDLALEVDSCEACRLCWLDTGELEVMQIVAERGAG